MEEVSSSRLRRPSLSNVLSANGSLRNTGFCTAESSVRGHSARVRSSLESLEASEQSGMLFLSIFTIPDSENCAATSGSYSSSVVGLCCGLQVCEINRMSGLRYNNFPVLNRNEHLYIVPRHIKNTHTILLHRIHE